MPSVASRFSDAFRAKQGTDEGGSPSAGLPQMPQERPTAIPPPFDFTATLDRFTDDLNRAFAMLSVRSGQPVELTQDQFAILLSLERGIDSAMRQGLRDLFEQRLRDYRARCQEFVRASLSGVSASK